MTDSYISTGIKILCDNKDLLKGIFKKYKTDDSCNVFKMMIEFYKKMKDNDESAYKIGKRLLSICVVIQCNVKLSKPEQACIKKIKNNIEKICENNESTTEGVSTNDFVAPECKDKKCKPTCDKLCECDKCCKKCETIEDLNEIVVDIIKNYTIIKSVFKHYSENATKFINKFGMYEPDKSVNAYDVKYYNCLLDSLYTKVDECIKCINIKIKCAKKCTLVKCCKMLEFCETFILAIEKVIDPSGYSFIKLNINDTEYSLYYLIDGITYDNMFTTINDDLLVVPEVIKVVNSNIMLITQDIEIIKSIMDIKCQSVESIVCDIEETLDDEE